MPQRTSQRVLALAAAVIGMILPLGIVAPAHGDSPSTVAVDPLPADTVLKIGAEPKRTLRPAGAKPKAALSLPELSWRPLYNWGNRYAVTVSGWPPSKADGGRLWMGPYGDPWWHQEWWFGPKLGGTAYQMMVRHSAKCMDVEGPSLENLAPVHQWGCYQGNNQFWYFRDTGYYDDETGWTLWEIVNARSGKCLDIKDVNPDPKAYLQQYTCLSNKPWNQSFMVPGI